MRRAARQSGSVWGKGPGKPGRRGTGRAAHRRGCGQCRVPTSYSIINCNRLWIVKNWRISPTAASGASRRPKMPGRSAWARWLRSSKRCFGESSRATGKEPSPRLVALITSRTTIFKSWVLRRWGLCTGLWHLSNRSLSQVLQLRQEQGDLARELVADLRVAATDLQPHDRGSTWSVRTYRIKSE